MKMRWFAVAVAATTVGGVAMAQLSYAGTTTTPVPTAPVVQTVSGGWSVDANGNVTGTLPPGTTLDSLPSDPATPAEGEALRKAFKAGKVSVQPESALRPVSQSTQATAARQEIKAKRAGTSLSNHNGCVWMNSNGDPYGNFVYHGFMQLCASGRLWCHEYRNLSVNGGSFVYIEDTPANTGSGGSCGLPSISFRSSNYGKARHAAMIFYTHGINRTTGNQGTTYTEYVK